MIVWLNLHMVPLADTVTGAQSADGQMTTVVLVRVNAMAAFTLQPASPTSAMWLLVATSPARSRPRGSRCRRPTWTLRWVARSLLGRGLASCRWPGRLASPSQSSRPASLDPTVKIYLV